MGFKLGKNKVRKTLDYKYFPKNLVELRKIINKRYMKFFNLGGIATETIELDLNDIDVSQVKDFGWLFGDEAKNVEILDISQWDTSNVVNMTGMFDNCRKLKEIIGLENLNVSSVRYITRMFGHCEKLENIDISNWEFKFSCNCNDMFIECENLKKIIGIDKFENMNSTEGMFIGCNKLDKPDWYEK